MSDEQHPTARSPADDVDEMISAVVDGAASAEEVEAVLSDPAKRYRYEQFRSVRSIIADSFRTSPEELRRQNVSAVLDRVEAEDDSRTARPEPPAPVRGLHLARSRRAAAFAGLAAAVVALVAGLAGIGRDRRPEEQLAISVHDAKDDSAPPGTSSAPTMEFGAGASPRPGGESGSSPKSERRSQETESLASGDTGSPSASEVDAATAPVPFVRLGDFSSADELTAHLVDAYGGAPESGAGEPGEAVGWESAVSEVRDPITIPCMDALSSGPLPESNPPQVVALASIRGREVVAFLWQVEATSQGQGDTGGTGDSTESSVQDHSTLVTVVDSSDCKPLIQGADY
ncbi:MAG: hypothetical protein KatS3mg008_1423 [Acidimicrobiales bacterium]|nr:MAG: hypothetical protein KatS3mg008_1423 [Acidimicrobiales bacterium]